MPTMDKNWVLPNEFELSSDDKAEMKSLSVWAQRLTSPEQARDFIVDKKEACEHYCTFLIERVRSLRPHPDDERIGPLNVVWDPLRRVGEDGSMLPDTRPGSEGHSGITGLFRESGLGKAQFLSLRSQLADLANPTLSRIVGSKEK